MFLLTFIFGGGTEDLPELIKQAFCYLPNKKSLTKIGKIALDENLCDWAGLSGPSSSEFFLTSTKICLRLIEESVFEKIKVVRVLIYFYRKLLSG